MTRLSSQIRQSVRARAKNRCEYCRLPDGFTTFNHQVDHIIPHRHGGTDDLNNLAWACFRCNNNKSTDIASFDFDTDEFVFLFHPRKQIWSEHFALIEGIIEGQTAIGRVTVRLLNMNDIERVDTRRDLQDAGLWE